MEHSQKYLRHFSLEEVGIAGQKKISESRVLIVGAGGLGVPACLYLASSGVGYIGICDDDVIESSNLARQVLYSKNDIGKKKVSVLNEKISSLNPEIKICAYDIALTEQNAKALFKDYDLVLNGSDNFKTRYTINKFAVELDIPWVDAAVLKFSGQISYFLPNQGCYNCLFPQIKESETNCNNEGILAPLCGMFGSWAAVNTLKIILSLIHENIYFEFNAKENSVRHFKWKKRSDCPTCGNLKTPTMFKTNKTIQTDMQISAQGKKNNLRISQNELSFLSSFILVDLAVYSTMNHAPSSLPNKISASLADFFSQDLDDPLFIRQHGDKTQTYVCVCEAGLKSKIAAEILVEEGFKALWLG